MNHRFVATMLRRARLCTVVFLLLLAGQGLGQTFSYLGQFGTAGSTNGQFAGPGGVAIDPTTRNIVVTDVDNFRVQVFDSAGNSLTRFGSSGCGTGQFGQPYGVAIDPLTHNILVAAAVCNRVSLFSSSGAYVGTFGTYGFGNGQFQTPSALAVDPVTRNIVVADSDTNHVQIFDSTGRFLSQVGTPNSNVQTGTGNGQFNSPRGVAIDPFTHNIVVADSQNHRVQIFNSAGSYLSQFGSEGAGNGQFSMPLGVAIDPANANIVVGDYGRGVIEVFTSTGLFVAQFGTFGKGNGQFENPYGLAIDPVSRNIVIADQTNNRVQIFSNGSGAGQCTYALTSSNASAIAAGQAGSVGVTSVNGCAWTAVSNVTWMHIMSGAAGTGSGTVGYTVDANAGGQRTGTLTVAGLTYTVIQAGIASSGPALGFDGNVTASLTSNTVTLLIDSIANRRTTTTGSLRIELWALTAAYNGSGGNGYRIAQSVVLDPLAPNTQYANVSQTLQIAPPSSGTWYLVLFITEYTATSANDGFSIVDWHNFADLWTIAVVIEFYNTILDNYFITANGPETAAIDGGSAGPGWGRTSTWFASGGNVQVCRFYGSQSPGPNSHFYTADPNECASLKQLQAITPITQKRWNFESLDFQTTPLVAGACPAGTRPVYRAYNNGSSRGIDSNHRISVNLSDIQQVTSRGWTNEGIVMCAPP